MTRIAIIPARGGSRRIPHKNIRHFRGKPIIAHSIELALSCGLFDEVYVSTDSPGIASLSEDYGAFILTRPAWAAVDEVGTQAVMTHHLREMLSRCIDYACCIYATAPLIDPRNLREGFDAVRADADYAFAVNACPLFDAGQFYWGRAGALLAGSPLVSRWSRLVPVAPERVCDINVEADWVRAEELWDKLHPQEG